MNWTAINSTDILTNGCFIIVVMFQKLEIRCVIKILWFSIGAVHLVIKVAVEDDLSFFDKSYKGWWNRLLITDVNSDGKPDIVAGNFGTNSQCRVNEKEPAELYYKDFDNNGTIDPVLCFYIQHKSYPYVTRDEMINQVPLVHTRFPTFKSYADATINDIFTPGEMAGAARLEATELKTSLFISGSDGKFHNTPMPVECQFSPVFTITELDYDNDGKKDLLLCGNINHARLRFGKSDANYGILLKGDGRGNFTYIPQRQSGFHIRGDVRSVLKINGQLFFGLNQESIKSYKMMPVKK